MWSFSRILCRFGRHHRSRGQARRIEGGWRSRCRRCGKPMVKFGDDDWMVEAAGDAGALITPLAGTSVDDGANLPAKHRRWPFARWRKSAPAAE